MSDIMTSLRCPCKQLLQNYKAQRPAVFLKDTLSRMKNCSRYADLFVP